MLSVVLDRVGSGRAPRAPPEKVSRRTEATLRSCGFTSSANSFTLRSSASEDVNVVDLLLSAESCGFTSSDQTLRGAEACEYTEAESASDSVSRGRFRLSFEDEAELLSTAMRMSADWLLVDLVRVSCAF